MQTYDEIEPLKNNDDKDQKTFTLKLVLAGSGQNNFRKVKNDENGPVINQKDYFSVKNDLTNFGENNTIKSAVKSMKIKQGDFFYKYHEQQNKLSLYRPGPGANLEDESKIDYRFDSGRYSIENSISLCVNELPKLVGCLLNSEYKVELIILGHSRGGVAANMIKERFKLIKKEKKWGGKVNIPSVSFDAVKGSVYFGSYTANLKKQESDEEKDTDTSAIVVSVNPKRGLFGWWGFSPQQILGADVIIFTSLGHSVGTENLFYDSDANKYTKPRWEYDNKIYKYGKIYKLEPGIYYQTDKTEILNENINKTETNEETLFLDSQNHNATNTSVKIHLEKLPETEISQNSNWEMLSAKLNEMESCLLLKTLMKKHSTSRKNLIIDLLNEKYANDQYEIIYDIKDGFQRVEAIGKLKGFFRKCLKSFLRHTGF